MKKIKCFIVIAAVCLFGVIGCMNGDELNSGKPVVTTPSASSSTNSAVSAGGTATNSSLSIVDSSYNSDTIRIDTLRK